MAYRGCPDAALAVGKLQHAEGFYGRLFGLAVTFRETQTADGWRTLGGTGWNSAHAAGIEPQLSSLRRDDIVLALRHPKQTLVVTLEDGWAPAGRTGRPFKTVQLPVAELDPIEARRLGHFAAAGADALTFAFLRDRRPEAVRRVAEAVFA
jgi:hypothetical protein